MHYSVVTWTKCGAMFNSQFVANFPLDASVKQF